MRTKKRLAISVCMLLLVSLLATGCDDGLPRAPEGGLRPVTSTSATTGTTTTTTNEEADSITTTLGHDTSSGASTTTTTDADGSKGPTTTVPIGNDSPTLIGENTVFDFVNDDGVEGNLAIKDKFGNTARCEYISLAKDVDGISRTWSDFTFIGDKLWVFFPSTDEVHSKKDGIIRIYHPETGKLEKSFYHNLGHCNTVDYNVDTDQLLIGNAPGNDDYPAALYIFDGVASWKDRSEDSVFLFNEMISTIVDLSDIVREGTTHATNATACWGEGDNTVYVNGSFGQYWWKIVLGTGSDNLGKGTYRSASDEAFNGSYKVSWMRSFTSKYSTYQECVQGMVYYDDCIHTANGHHKIQWWEWMTYGNGMSRSEHHIAPVDENGNGQNSISEGIAIYNGYLYIGCLYTDKGSDDYAENHAVCTGDHGIIKVKLQ